MSAKESQAGQPVTKPKRALKDYFRVTATGFFMGCADVVPGVSGGTIAFISGIYEELIDSIRMLATPKVLGPLFRFDVPALLRVVRWEFLCALFLGILSAIFTLAKGIEWLLENQPVYLWAFFFGLVLASVVSVSRRQKQWSAQSVGMMVAGSVGAYWLVGLVPLQTPNASWFLFLSGMLAICAMILPGISGSFILVLLGKYQYILEAVNNRDFMVLFIVAMGCGVGIISIAQVLGWLFKKYHDPTIALLTGFMLGSLRKVWPWKEVVQTIPDRHGHLIPIEEHNFMPDPASTEFFTALVLAAAGFGAVMLLDWYANRQGPAPA